MNAKFFRVATVLAVIYLLSVTAGFADDGEKSGFHGWGDSQRATSSGDGAQQQQERIKELPPQKESAKKPETMQEKQTASAGEDASPRAELREKIQREREAFFEDTKKLRQEIYQKRLELRSELAKSDPSARRAKSIQKDIAKQRSELDRMRLEHFLKLKKIDPQMGRGEKPGRDGYGSCPNCPYRDRGYRGEDQMMGPGYGDRHHMMGPGYGRHHMWEDDDDWKTGPRGDKQEWSQEDPSQKSLKAAAELSQSDARAIVMEYLKSTRNPNLKIGQITDAGSAFQAEIVTKDGSLVDKLLVDKQSGYMRPAY